jgi:hypothetical protein
LQLIDDNDHNYSHNDCDDDRRDDFDFYDANSNCGT